MSRQQLAEKNAEIADKNELIKNLRLEIERMRALIVPKIEPSSKENGDDHTSSGYDRGEEIVVSDVMTFDDDIE